MYMQSNFFAIKNHFRKLNQLFCQNNLSYKINVSKLKIFKYIMKSYKSDEGKTNKSGNLYCKINFKE